MTLTVLIITKNAAETLSQTLESIAPLTQEIMIIDDNSTDKTIDIASGFRCRIIRHHSEDFGLQRSFALEQVVSEWTLVLDSDEVLTKQNRDEIKAAIVSEQWDGYRLRFRNHLFGKKLMQGELHKKLVLFKTKKTSSSQKLIHEEYRVEGKVGELKSEILHFSYRSVKQITTKFLDYSIRQAKEYKREKKQIGFRELFLNPLHMFYARFIEDGGYKDGVSRIVLDSAFAGMEFLSYFLAPFVKEKMRISVDCGAHSVGNTVHSGIDRLIEGIYSGVSKEHEYYWFTFSSSTSHTLPKRFFSQLWLPVATITHRCDVFLGVAGTIPPLLRFFPVKKILFMYDFGFFTSPAHYGQSAKKLQNQTEYSIHIADKIIVLHEEIYAEFVKKYPQYSYKVEIIPSGADHLERVPEKPVFVQKKDPFILYVGVVKPVKQIEKILSVIGDAYCIIAGQQEEEYVKTLQITASQHVHFIQNFNDAQLKWLYKNADVMVYTSAHEGFCYPVLEALSLGLSVIALDLPIFQTYKRHFPHLILVQTLGEMKQVLKERHTKEVQIKNNHPYRWITFNERLTSLWIPQETNTIQDKKVGFIVVLYNTSISEKKKLEQDIVNLKLPAYRIYWIDNTTTSKGYAAGVNVGIRRGLSDSCDYFFALNPDISLSSLLEETFLFVAQIFDIWGYGMRQRETVYFGGTIDKWRLSGGLIQKRPSQRFASVDFVSGSLIGFSRQVVQSIGFWNEDYFMYYEDVDYCVRARKAGFSVGVDSTAVYIHNELSQNNEKKKAWIAKARWTFFWKYANGVQIIREIARLPKTLVEAHKK